MAARRATNSGIDNSQARRDSHHQPITSLDNCKKKELPPGFAETILELEIYLDNEFIEIEKVKELLELYMIGVEYYESIGDQRFIYFNKKMSSLMMKPNVIDAMSRDGDKQNGNPQQQAKSKEEALREAEIKQKEEQIRKTVNYSHQDNDEKAKAIVKNVQQEIKQNQKIIHDSLDTQKRQLFERLQNRRAKTLTKASSVPVLNESMSSDNDDTCSSQEGSAVITSRIDFSSITNAIREDDQEDDNEEDINKQRPKAFSRLDRIRKFKEELLNGKTSPTNDEGRVNRYSLCSNSKSRSNSQSIQMGQRNSCFSRKIREKKVSFIKQKRRIRSKSQENINQESMEGFLPLTVDQLKEMQDQINLSLKQLAVKQIEPFTVNLSFKQVIQEKQEEDDEQTSPIRQLKRHS
ncbi:hypothetical protein TTHERM_00616170 (macronuclear) [Tetrahymena thermophila SB210]|uniref:Uncharacterized protein n=1 Tax=Tetrahymena thermophila (strain SB210) TaxID=312017 RepID=I7LXD9_TETTS|nr:hypothetical protein TTHERM_00616170 [Tetrahymena thermophila SB210]EAS04442.1 hypothetical protein TTHERM_00616170 [Tetrahymena thermophila SB210]|eukprot:XP_001024687.1 hypothetical protein TTHERM_00616170 [Tetrahymena thermophila SB210]